MMNQCKMLLEMLEANMKVIEIAAALTRMALEVEAGRERDALVEQAEKLREVNTRLNEAAEEMLAR
jgi:hypothetical protein